MRLAVYFPDLEDGGWVGAIPSLPGCVSQGETKEELLRNLSDAGKSWISAAQSNGMKIPSEVSYSLIEI